MTDKIDSTLRVHRLLDDREEGDCLAAPALAYGRRAWFNWRQGILGLALETFAFVCNFRFFFFSYPYNQPISNCLLP